MKIYTKIELENKVKQLHEELQNPFLNKKEIQQIQHTKTYYIFKLVELDETPNAKTIKA